MEVRRDGFRYTLHFEHGENIGGLKKEPYAKKDTGTVIRFKPDIQVFTDIQTVSYTHLELKASVAEVSCARNTCEKGIYLTILDENSRIK